MMDVNTAERIHNILIDQFGGSKGVRDIRGLEAALARPFSTFDGNDLYDTVIDKAAALFESLIISHPFVDGNKRVSYVLMRLLLLDLIRISRRPRMKNMNSYFQPAPAQVGSTRSGTGYHYI